MFTFVKEFKYYFKLLFHCYQRLFCRRIYREITVRKTNISIINIVDTIISVKVFLIACQIIDITTHNRFYKIIYIYIYIFVYYYIHFLKQ